MAAIFWFCRNILTQLQVCLINFLEGTQNVISQQFFQNIFKCKLAEQHFSCSPNYEVCELCFAWHILRVKCPNIFSKHIQCNLVVQPFSWSTIIKRYVRLQNYLGFCQCRGGGEETYENEMGINKYKLDRIPVSVSEWLFGSFVLILFGDYVYFSWFNSHISKEWDGNAV